MRFNFRKIASVLASAVMIGGTAGTALAANYPAPFVVGGAADGAIVVTSGSHAGAVSDWDAAVSLQSSLQNLVTTTAATTGATTTGGDSYKIERASTKFQMGKGILDIVSGTVTDTDMPNLLADGTFLDSDNNEKDYTQKLTLANLTLGMFDDNDYAEDAPTVGIKISSAGSVLNYTLSFTDQPAWDKLETANIKLLGKEYYILDANTPTNTSLTLLDSAETATIAEDETMTVANKEVLVTFIGDNQVKLNIDGEETNTLAQGETYKLSDGSYVGIKDIMYTSKTGAVSKVEFSVGSGKLKLTNGQDIEMNDDSISRLKAYLGGQGGANLQSITIEWKADGELFVAPDSEPEMPGFKAVKLTWGGMTYPVEEDIVVEAGGDDYVVLKNFPLKDSTETINLLYGNNANWTGIGKDSDNVLRTVESGNLTFDGDTDDYFVATYDDGTNAESYLMRATNFKVESSVNKTTIQYKSDGTWTNVQSDVSKGDDVTLGSVTLTVGTINYNDRTVVLKPGINVNFNTLYSKEGLKVYLPYTSTTIQNSTTEEYSCDNVTWSTGLVGPVNLSNTYANASVLCYSSTFDLAFVEEDKNENKASGSQFNATLGWNTATTAQAYVSDIVGESATFSEQDDTDKYLSYVYSPLATKLLWDKSGDQYALTLTYHGSESYGNVFVAAPEVTVSEGTTTAAGGGQILVVKDSEVDSVKNKNLIVVGGSCINSVAAEVLGVDYPTCGADFTTATNVGAGQYLIKAVKSPYNAEKTAVLVAGYEAADTKNAADKLAESHATDVGTENIYPEVTA